MTFSSKGLLSEIRWKYLLAIFKFKRTVGRVYSKRRLDYSKFPLYVMTDNVREYETRARSVRKEPETVAWIEKHTRSETILYDVGANIGAYTLVAAALGAKVIAFEPALQNANRLQQNIILNDMSEKCVVFPVVLAAKGGVVESFIKDRTQGISHSFSFHEKQSSSLSKQSFPAIELDTCIEKFFLPLPTIIKIDVDGAEMDVLKGAQKTLVCPELKSILIEVDKQDFEVRNYLEKFGFSLTRQDVSGDTTINYIFDRT
jgi:FkbM family methyltransferase